MADDTPVTAHRIERVMAFMIVSIVALSVISFAATMIGLATDVDYSAGIWPAVLVMPGIGLPVAFVLMIVLLVVSITRRRRESGDAER